MTVLKLQWKAGAWLKSGVICKEVVLLRQGILKAPWALWFPSPFPLPSLFSSTRKERGQKDPGCFHFSACQEVIALCMQGRLWELLTQSYSVKLLTRNRKLTQICSDPGLCILTKLPRFPRDGDRTFPLFVKRPLAQSSSRNYAK